MKMKYEIIGCIDDAYISKTFCQASNLNLTSPWGSSEHPFEGEGIFIELGHPFWDDFPGYIKPYKKL